MWLLITGGAALIASVLWYLIRPRDRYRLGFLCLILWGATLMWLVDHVMAYIQEGGPFVEFGAEATALGVSVLVLGLLIWLVRLSANHSRRALRAVFKR